MDYKSHVKNENFEHNIWTTEIQQLIFTLVRIRHVTFSGSIRLKKIQHLKLIIVILIVTIRHHVDAQSGFNTEWH